MAALVYLILGIMAGLLVNNFSNPREENFAGNWEVVTGNEWKWKINTKFVQ